MANGFVGQTTRVSVSPIGEPANSSASAGVISGDGRYVVFMSSATNLVEGLSTRIRQVYRYDRLSRTTELVSGTIRNPGNNVSGDPSISDDGSYVVFSSFATNLVEGDTNGMPAVFRRNMNAGGTTELVSAATPGVVGLPGSSGLSGLPGAREISDNGRFVVFNSLATNLVTASNNGKQQVYRKDMDLHAVERVSVNETTGEAGDQLSQMPSISGDGRYVAFTSYATNLSDSSRTGVLQQVFVRDLGAHTTTLESKGTADVGKEAAAPVLSEHGEYVAYVAYAPLDVLDLDNGVPDVYLRNRVAGTIELASRSLNRIGGDSLRPSISRDGRWVGFDSMDETMVGNDGNGTMRDAFLYDRVSKTVTLVSLNDAGVAADQPSGGPLGGVSVSSNGHLVLFGSTASNLVGSTSALTNQLYVRVLGENGAPIVFVGDQTVIEGEPLRVIGRFSDTDASTSWKATVDYGAGPVDLPLNSDKTFSLTHEPFRLGTYVVRVSVLDDAFATGTASFTLTVLPSNRAPVVNSGGDETVNEGTWLKRVGTFSDLDGSTSWRGTADYGTGSVPLIIDPVKKLWLFQVEPFAPGSYVITISVTDNQGATGSATFRHTVANVAPSIVGLGGDVTIYFGSKLHREVSLGDPGMGWPVPQPAETYTATVDYGDGTGKTDLSGVVFMLDHAYPRAGTYVVSFTAADSNGGTSSANLTVNVLNYSFEWLDPVGDMFVVGRNLPVKFTVQAPDGSFILDQSVFVAVYDTHGSGFVWYSFGDQPSRSVTASGGAYHVNVDTRDLVPGAYVLRVTFTSPTLTGTFDLTTNGTASALTSTRSRLR